MEVEVDKEMEIPVGFAVVDPACLGPGDERISRENRICDQI
jgi:hypothetical protein